MKNSKQTNRRNFIKKTTLVTTGIISTTLPVRSFANVLDNKKLKLALVGCGGRGSGAVEVRYGVGGDPGVGAGEH